MHAEIFHSARFSSRLLSPCMILISTHRGRICILLKSRSQNVFQFTRLTRKESNIFRIDYILSRAIAIAEEKHLISHVNFEFPPVLTCDVYMQILFRTCNFCIYTIVIALKPQPTFTSPLSRSASRGKGHSCNRRINMQMNPRVKNVRLSFHASAFITTVNRN